MGSMIKMPRLELKLSQQELGSRIGVTRPTISAIEKGKPNVAIGSVVEAAYIMGLPLMGEEDPKE
ncbi:MAG TPA: helix-turn-helix domain-containing protein [Leucothrix mucor]|nr:helix-turn-helix domain-containing protein [Leucothrix mucor]